MISVSFSKTIGLFTYQLSDKEKNRQSLNDNNPNDSEHTHLSIELNPSPKSNDVVVSYEEQYTILPFDDDEELIKSDILSITASNFCQSHSIKLRLDQDVDYDTDILNESQN